MSGPGRDHDRSGDRHGERHEDHIWRSAAPRPVGDPTPGARWIGLAFVVLVAIVLLVVVVLIAGGLVSTDAPRPGRT